MVRIGFTASEEKFENGRTDEGSMPILKAHL